MKPVVKHHGVPFLEKKQAYLNINESNKNDIKKLLGNPSTKSKFDNDVWIYIERKQTQSKLKNLGKKKNFYNIDDMNDIKIVESTTEAGFKRNSFIYDFMSSMRQKINDPLGKRVKNNKEISQR